jgi:RNA methyltransferase, TrmH family
VQLSQSEIKYFRSLQQKKIRERERKFLLEGWRPLRDALESSFHIEMITVLPSEAFKPEHHSLLSLVRKQKIQVKELTEVQLKQIANSVHSQGIVALVRQKEIRLDSFDFQSKPLIVACDRVSDPGNLGTILRTCDWFGVDTIFFNEGCVSLYNEKVIRATAGSIFHLNVFEHLDLNTLFSSFKSQGFTTIATALDAKPMNTLHVPRKTILLLGSEAHGIHSELLRSADEVVSIPRQGKAESLNVGVAAGILLEYLRNQLSE